MTVIITKHTEAKVTIKVSEIPDTGAVEISFWRGKKFATVLVEQEQVLGRDGLVELFDLLLLKPGEHANEKNA